LFANDGKGRFRDRSPSNPALCGTANVARGLAVADLDGDGALDLVLTTAGGRARLLRNVAPGRGHGLLVRAVEPPPGRGGAGGGGDGASGGPVVVAAGQRGRQLPVCLRQSGSLRPGLSGRGGWAGGAVARRHARVLRRRAG